MNSAFFFSRNKSTAFTLIEMLIVIVIIGILAAALVPRLNSIQWRARDAQRKTDFRNIYNANQIHKIDNGIYANQLMLQQSHSTSAANRITGLQAILGTVPRDPINNDNHRLTGGYSYYYYSVDGAGSLTDYQLFAQLENQKDPDRCQLKNYHYPHANDPINWLQWCPQVAYPATKWTYAFDSLNINRH